MTGQDLKTEFQNSAFRPFKYLVENATKVLEHDASPVPADGERVRIYDFSLSAPLEVTEMILRNRGASVELIGHLRLTDVDRSAVEEAHTALQRLGGHVPFLKECLDPTAHKEAKADERAARVIATGAGRRRFVGWR